MMARENLPGQSSLGGWLLKQGPKGPKLYVSTHSFINYDLNISNYTIITLLVYLLSLYLLHY